MNIDDFLDQTNDQDGSDIIDISKEDVSMPVPSDASVKTSVFVDGSVPSPVSAQASNLRTELDVSPMLSIAEVSDSKVSGSTLSTSVSSKSPSGTFVQQIRMYVANIKSALELKNISEAMKLYSSLVQLTHKVHSSNVSAKHRLDTLLLQINNEIQKTVSEQKTVSVVTSKKIDILIGKGVEFLLDRNVIMAQKIYNEVSALFQTLPAYFSDQKHEVNTHIIQFHLKLTNYKQRETSARFKKEFNTIKSLLYDVSMLISANKFKEAQQVYANIESVYMSMEEGFLDEKSKIYAVMLKKKHKIDVALQIQSLQHELGITKDALFAQPHHDVESQNKPLDASRASTTVTASPSAKEFVNRASAPLATTALTNTASNTHHAVHTSDHTSSLSSELSAPYSKDSIINEAIKNVKLSKVKILLLNQQFAQAFLIVSDLKKRFPQDVGVSDAYTQLQKNPKSPPIEVLQTEAAYVAEALKRVDSDVSQGNLQKALVDLEKIERDETNVELKGILKDLEKAIAHNPGDFEKEDAKFIRRKLLLAKHHYDKHNFSKAKEYVSLVLSHDPKHKEAKKLYALVS